MPVESLQQPMSKTFGQRPHGAVQTGSPPALSNGSHESINNSPPQGWTVEQLESLAVAWQQGLPKGYPPAWSAQPQAEFVEAYVPQNTQSQNGQQFQNGHFQDHTDEPPITYQNPWDGNIGMGLDDFPPPQDIDYTTFLNSGNEAPACVNPRDIMFDRGP